MSTKQKLNNNIPKNKIDSEAITARKVRIQIIEFAIVFLAIFLVYSLTSTPHEESTPLPVFEYPHDNQVLDYNDSYLFKIYPVTDSKGYLWGFFQNGELIWENSRDEDEISGAEYDILSDEHAHTHFVPGSVEIWVRAWLGNEWSEATILTIELRE